MGITDSTTKERAAADLGYCASNLMDRAQQLKLAGHPGDEAMVNLAQKMATRATKLLDEAESPELSTLVDTELVSMSGDARGFLAEQVAAYLKAIPDLGIAALLSNSAVRISIEPAELPGL